MIEIKNLAKNFGRNIVLNNINVTIEQGHIVGLIGANGAGKTTLIRTVMGIYEPDEGEVLINNENIYINPYIKDIVGYVPDKNDYFLNHKIKQILTHYKLTYSNFDEQIFHKINEKFNVPLSSRLAQLSKGNITKVFIMLALSIKPKILILDEPTAGLDVVAKKKILNILVNEVCENNTTVIISSHNLNELEAICDQILFIDKGTIIENTSLDNLKDKSKKLQIIFSGDAPKNFEKWSEFIKVEQVGKSYNVVTSNYNDDLINKLKENGAVYIEKLDMSLEDLVFNRLE